MSSTWADIVGYEGLYLVSDDGRVKSAATGNDLRQSVRNGYKCVNLWRDNKYKTKKVHRLVAQAFVPNPSQKTQINHIDGNKANNHANNLEWCTAGENNKHAYDARLRKPATANAISARRRAVIIDGANAYKSMTDAANALGVCVQCISNALAKGHKVKGHTIEHATA